MQNNGTKWPPIVDAHCDTMLEIAKGNHRLLDRAGEGHLDLNRMQAGGTRMQFFAAFIESEFKPRNCLQRALFLIEAFWREMEANRERIKVVKSWDDIESLFENEKLGALLSIEGGEAIEEELSLLRVLYRLGVRSMTLTWNQRNAIADGAAERDGGGLSNFGRDVVAEMNDVKMLIDVSHASRKTFDDVLQHTRQPVIASHSNADALCPHPRNLDDARISRLADNGGVMCITYVPDFLNPKGVASIEDVASHLEHVRSLVGADFIGLGSDFDGTEHVPIGLEDVSKVPALFQLLERRGFRDSELEKIAGGNVLRLLKDVMT